jgi:hypothetical protein
LVSLCFFGFLRVLFSFFFFVLVSFLYTTYMLRGTFTLFIKFICLPKKKDLINATNQADRAKVFILNNPYFFRNKGNEGHIQTFDEFATFLELKKHLYNFFFDNIPARLEESYRKTIWTQCLTPIQLFYYFEDLPFLENSLHPNSFLLTNRVERKTIQIWPPIFRSR